MSAQQTPGSRKARIPAAVASFLVAIDEYIRRYDMHGLSMASAASDVLDGWVGYDEISPLIARRWLSMQRYTNSWPSDPMCGFHFSVRLTKRAMRLFWPERAAIEKTTEAALSNPTTGDSHAG